MNKLLSPFIPVVFPFHHLSIQGFMLSLYPLLEILIFSFNKNHKNFKLTASVFRLFYIISNILQVEKKSPLLSLSFRTALVWVWVWVCVHVCVCLVYIFNSPRMLLYSDSNFKFSFKAHAQFHPLHSTQYKNMY